MFCQYWRSVGTYCPIKPPLFMVSCFLGQLMFYMASPYSVCKITVSYCSLGESTATGRGQRHPHETSHKNTTSWSLTIWKKASVDKKSVKLEHLMTHTSKQERPISNAKDAFQCQKNVLVTNHSKVKVWCDFLLYICSWEANLGQNGLWFTWVSCFYLLNKNDLLLYTTINSDNIIVPWNDDFKGLDSFSK